MTRTSREIKARFTAEFKVFESEDLQDRVVIANATLIERDENGIERDSGAIKLKGDAALGTLSRDITYRFFGRWFEHPAYGDQFHFESFVVDKPVTREAVIQYLRQCRGLGSVRAGKLFDLHGESSIDKLINSPREVAASIKGLTAEDAEEAAFLLAQSEYIRKTKLSLIELLNGKSMPRKLIKLLVDDYGAEAADIVRRNPYLLMRYRNCGFLKCDKLYLSLGHNPSRLKRQALCAWHAIAKVSEGDTWFQYGQSVRAIRENVSGTEARVDRAIELAIRAGLLRVREGLMGTKWIAEERKAQQEERVLRLVVEAYIEARDNPESVSWPDVSDLNVSGHQQEALKIALQGFVCFLAGGPGTGKTHSTAELLKQIIQQHGIDHVSACAPSGKAAVRMSEALAKAGVRLQAKTIHSTLKVLSSDSGWSFEYNERKPLPFKFIFADESSMDDVPLMGSLLAARARGAHICFIGDIDQLSPVGHGAPMRDAIAAGVPTGKLTETRRNSGRIVDSCRLIRESRKFSCSPKVDLEAGENLGLIERDTAEAQIEALQSVMDRFRASGTYDPVWDIQVLCAVNKKTSQLNRKILNRSLQKQLNPHGERAGSCPFWVGDKVICLKNGWFKPVIFRQGMDVNKKGEVYVANGEQGEVITVELSRFTVRLQAPDREVIVYRSNRTDEDDEESADPNDESGEESTGTGCKWDLGYAISVHKSQGSEWPVVITMLDDSGAAKQVCTRNWLYTAISRAKTLGLLIGTHSRAQEMCFKDGLQRKTFLEELIREGIKEADRELDNLKWNDVFCELLEGVV